MYICLSRIQYRAIIPCTAINRYLSAFADLPSIKNIYRRTFDNSSRIDVIWLRLDAKCVTARRNPAAVWRRRRIAWQEMATNARVSVVQHCNVSSFVTLQWCETRLRRYPQVAETQFYPGGLTYREVIPLPALSNIFLLLANLCNPIRSKWRLFHFTGQELKQMQNTVAKFSHWIHSFIYQLKIKRTAIYIFIGFIYYRRGNIVSLIYL